MPNEFRFEQLAEHANDESSSPLKAPARLKSRAYTALIHAQQEAGPLLDLTATKRSGRELCVFEQLVQIAPVGDGVESKFFCQVCHARILAENLEHAPIYWHACPYVKFQR
jgi:hypothetical protein